MLIVGVEGRDYPEGFSAQLGIGAPDNLDMVLFDEGERYVIRTFTDGGKDLVKNDNIKAADMPERDLQMDEGEKLDLKKIEAFLDKGPDQPLWHELAEKCFACGACSYVCPICHCFDVEDRISLSGNEGERMRCWDSCMLADFAAVAGGGNFRKERYERIHNWYHHKFSRAIKERGEPDCVGCGRCIQYCPAKIDILGAIKECERQG